ncbi:unnamed protein product [Cylindrotheca closterium]|uniref:Uncharacterized protein n=1 Tax=Cylindrotheca closterium TaxID=2856 RepID=A0AAD2PX93_9STRA|nr:unnamed protein product [Cylindrotheca closterium]
MVENVVTPEQVLFYGFESIGSLPTITADDYTEHNIFVFKAHFGTTPSAFCHLWEDIMSLKNKDLGLLPSDKSEEGIKRLLGAIHFLWEYPEKATIIGISEQMVQREKLWHWLKVIG